MAARKKFYGAGSTGYQPGKKRKHKGSFLHEHHGRVVPKGRKREKDARYAISSKGFSTQHREIKTIRYHGAGYGLGRGHGHHASGYTLSAATKAKISASLKKYYATHKVHRKSHPVSQATKEKISASLKRYDATHPAAVRARTIKAAATRRRNKATKPR